MSLPSIAVILSFREYYINRIIVCNLWDALSMWQFPAVHPGHCMYQALVPFCSCVSSMCGCGSVQPGTCRNTLWFPVLVATNRAALNIHEQFFCERTFSFLWDKWPGMNLPSLVLEETTKLFPVAVPLSTQPSWPALDSAPISLTADDVGRLMGYLHLGSDWLLHLLLIF